MIDQLAAEPPGQERADGHVTRRRRRVEGPLGGHRSEAGGAEDAGGGQVVEVERDAEDVLFGKEVEPAAHEHLGPPDRGMDQLVGQAELVAQRHGVGHA